MPTQAVLLARATAVSTLRAAMIASISFISDSLVLLGEAFEIAEALEE